MASDGCCPPCCPQFSPPDFPFLQVCMMEPPCAVAPTAPEYVKPLTLPNVNPPLPPPRDIEQEFKNRKSNFYNYYNVDYRKTGTEPCDPPSPKQARKTKWCEDYRITKTPSKGCPTGFKPCEMRLCPPPCCNPLGTWTATVMPCPPKPRRKPDVTYVPGPCKRPCCLHWTPKGGFCKYDAPCKAHCYDHPPGIKPSGRTC